MTDWIFDKRLPKANLLTVRWWSSRGIFAKFRLANAMQIHIGRLEISWRMPWLRRSRWPRTLSCSPPPPPIPLHRGGEMSNASYTGVMVAAIGLLAIGYLVFTANSRPEVRGTMMASSDLYVFVDDGTGCHYIGRQTESLTPRLDASGKQICRKGER